MLQIIVSLPLQIKSDLTARTENTAPESVGPSAEGLRNVNTLAMFKNKDHVSPHELNNFERSSSFYSDHSIVSV